MSSVAHELLQGGHAISLRRLGLAHICARQLPIFDVLFAHELLEEADDFVHHWSFHSSEVGDALVHGDTLRDVFCEIAVCEVRRPAALHFLHGTPETLVAVATANRRGESTWILDL